MPTPAIFRLRPIVVFVCLSVVLAANAENEYKLGPESTNRFAGVPKGRVEKFQFAESKVFPDTTRDCWIYIPAQYDGSKSAALMVFQDGGGYVSETGGQRVPIVFDNLIAKGEMPVTIGVFINPGNRTASDSPAAGANNRRPDARIAALCKPDHSHSWNPMPLTAPGHGPGGEAESPAAGICWRSTRRWARASSGPGSTPS